MVSLFRRSSDDLGLLRSTVESLGATSVPGLAAALAWRERRTERALVEELARPGTPLTYDPALRVVRWAPLIVEAPAPVPQPDLAPPPVGTPHSAPTLHPTLTAAGARLTCPSCHVPLVAASSGSLVVCPKCGRLATTRSREPSSPAPDRATESSSTPVHGPASLPDRRSQEMFAAYVTSRPIPCPRCRTPLRHKGLSEYACPSCGETVRFGSSPPSTGSAPSRSTPTPAAIPPAATPGRENVPAPVAPAGNAARVSSSPRAGERSSSGVGTAAMAAMAALAEPSTAPAPVPAPGASELSSVRGRLRRSIAGLGHAPAEPSPRATAPKKSTIPRARASCRVPPRYGTDPSASDDRAPGLGPARP